MITTVIIHEEEPINIILPAVEDEDTGIFDETFDETFE